MKRNIFPGIIGLLLFLCFFNFPLYSQECPNSIYLELLGNGGLYSINYDRQFSENSGGRIGLMYLSRLEFIFSSINDIVIIPVTFNYFITNTGDTAESSHKLELGVGIAFLSITSAEFWGFETDKGASFIGGTATIGYRYQQSEGGLLFRIGFTPYFSSNGFFPWVGVSIGTSF